MSEPMGSFGEWKCSECGTVQLVETEWHRKPRFARWPVGWRIVTGDTFARVVCPKCVAEGTEPR